jgi:uncharacterized membrane protein YjgN (DUF898 family)
MATPRQRFQLWVLAWVCLAQSIVEIVTLGFVIPEWRPKVLFSKWMDD